MSPVISCNVPDYLEGSIDQKGSKPESVGIPLPDLSAKIVNPENYNEERTSKALYNGWYVAGDLAKCDDE